MLIKLTLSYVFVNWYVHFHCHVSRFTCVKFQTNLTSFRWIIAIYLGVHFFRDTVYFLRDTYTYSNVAYSILALYAYARDAGTVSGIRVGKQFFSSFDWKTSRVHCWTLQRIQYVDRLAVTSSQMIPLPFFWTLKGGPKNRTSLVACNSCIWWRRKAINISKCLGPYQE